ncbi:hypothetical protein [Escherichia coli]
MRDRSGYICDRSEIGQRPPLQRVYSSATFEQLLTQVCQTWPATYPQSPPAEDMAELLSWKTASQPYHHQRQERWILCRDVCHRR